MHIEIGRRVEPEPARGDRAGAEQGAAATCARPSRTGPRCTRRRWRSSRTWRRTRRRCPTRRSPRARRCCSGWPTTHFTFLGYREYRLEDLPGGEDVSLRAVPGTGFGILRSDQDMSAAFGKLPPLVRDKAREKTLLVLAKANSKSTVHRPVYLDYVGVKTFDENGEVVGERRFLGLFSSAAYTESLTRIPVIRVKAKQVIDRAGFDAAEPHRQGAHGRAGDLPARRAVLDPDRRAACRSPRRCCNTRERRQLRLFVRRDTYGRYLSCLVYLPRDRYTTAVRERIAEILKRQLHGDSLEYTARVSESLLARLHFVVRPKPGELIARLRRRPTLERRLAEAARSWRDDFVAAAHAEYGEEDGALLARNYADSFPEAYKEDYPPRTGAVDLGRLEGIPAEGGLDLSFYRPVDGGPREARLKIFRIGSPLSLSEVLPILSSMGVEVVDERPYGLDGTERPSYIYDFGLRYGRELPREARELFQDAVNAVWEGDNEVDGFNGAGARRGADLAAGDRAPRLREVHAAGRHPVRAGLHRGRARPTTSTSPARWCELFEARFDPGRGERPRPTARPGTRRPPRSRSGSTRALDDVASLDHDRILRSYLTVITATLRTNYFQPDADGLHQVLHLAQAAARRDPGPAGAAAEVRDLRLLAAGRGRAPALRRGRPRRPALVRPARRLPHRGARPGEGADGEEHRHRAGRREGRLLLQAAARPRRPGGVAGRGRRLLQDVHLRPARHHRQPAARRDGDRSVPPERVVRHDGDDTYLVVAADKGTATFSDIANGVAQDYGFWLGDAFASGGSVGYDHKVMGITARGAWESVRRHFREMGVDCQNEEFTCVGVGDMSGDVFGNGMLLSRHTRLVAAFDHRDIFLDPVPVAATSYDERKRLFDLPRSSWQDYDTSLISEGGGVFSRAPEGDPGHARRCGGAVARRLGGHADAGAADAGDPARRRRPALERRHRDLRQERGRDRRRGRRQGQRRDPGARPRPALPVRGGGRQPRPHAARAHRVRPLRVRRLRRPDQHRLHRQLRRRRHLRPRGEHQDPARPGGGQRRPHRRSSATTCWRR